MLKYNQNMKTPKIKFTIITLFEEAIRPYLETSMMWKAHEKGIAEFDFVNLRDFGLGPHKSVDDTPYGGGDGMLLRCEPVFAAIESIKEKDPSAKVILPTPAGDLWTQDWARRLAMTGGSLAGRTELSAHDRSGSLQSSASEHLATTGASSRVAPVTTGRDEASERAEALNESAAPHYVILCPHYEGYDERILSIVDYKFSLGRYILTGGELPALIIIDSIVRLLPGVLGGENSAVIESFSDGETIEYPQYTKPADFRGMKVPEVLLSGHHGKVAEWRKNHQKPAKML